MNGTEDGLKFLSTRPLAPDTEWFAREKRLRDLVGKLSAPGLTESAVLALARQFIWDTKSLDWILVDWEGLLSC